MRTAAVVIGVLCLVAPASWAQTPHRSFGELPSTNGWGSVHIYLPEAKVAAFYPHLYRQWSAETGITPNLMYDGYFGLRAPAQWFSELAVDEAGYEPGTNIAYMVQHASTGSGDATVVTRLFAPFDLAAPGFVMELEVHGPTPPVALFSLLNFRVGAGDERTEGETIRSYRNGYLEEGDSGYFVYYRPVTSADGVQAGPAGPTSPYQVMKDGGDFGTLGGTVQGDDLAVGFQFNLPDGIQEGSVATVAVVVAAGESWRRDEIVDAVESYVGASSPEELLSRARHDWQQFQARATLPQGLSEDEERLLRAGLVVLRMAQVQEDTEPQDTEPCGGPHGQILAALPKARPAPGEGIWNIAWVRDGAYAIVALARLGYVDEAEAGLEFMLRAHAGEYAQAVGYDYAISVCRYYGCGREESDWDHNGPNIEFDDFGLFLWAFSEVAAVDPGWAREHASTVADMVADVLSALVERSTFLVAPDSSIWERHWNGGEKHFTYTDAVAVRGLCAFSEVAPGLGIEDGRIQVWRDAVSMILKGIRLNLIRNGVVVGNMEEPEGQNLDMAAVEVLNFGILKPSEDAFIATLEAWHQRFYDGDGTWGGYFRNDDGDWYDEQEWTFIDLRASIAWRLAGSGDRADALLGWVTAQSLQNFGLMGELYCRGSVDCPTRGDYRGSVPMVGFGPGAYALALFARSDPAPSVCVDATDGEPGIEIPPQSEGEDASDSTDSAGSEDGSGPDGGCSCSTPAARSEGVRFLTPVALFLLLAIVLRRRVVR